MIDIFFFEITTLPHSHIGWLTVTISRAAKNRSNSSRFVHLPFCYITSNQSGHGKREREKVRSLHSLIMAQGLIFSRDPLQQIATVESAECLSSCILRSLLNHFSSALAITAAREAEDAIYIRAAWL